MERIRSKITTWIWRIATRLCYWINYQRFTPPEETEWHLRQSDPTNLIVTVLFFYYPGDVTYTDYHVAILVENKKGCVLIDDTAGRTIIRPMLLENVDKFIIKLRADYAVHVKVDNRYRKDITYTPEAHSCVSLVKKILGVDDSTILTPEHLLEHLRRCYYG